MSGTFEGLTERHVDSQPWFRVADAFFDENKYSEHQIKSYNYFMANQLPDIITGSTCEYYKDSDKKNPKNIITFSNVYIKSPQFTELNGVCYKAMPNDCRTRNIRYSCQVYCDISREIIETDNSVQKETTTNVLIGLVPCMLQSVYCNLFGKDEHYKIMNGECPNDDGGYFIIKGGNEKVLMSYDRKMYNSVFTMKSKKKDVVKIWNNETEKYNQVPSFWISEMRSYNPTSDTAVTTTYVKLSKPQLEKGEEGTLFVEIPTLISPVPLHIIFIIFDITDREKMLDMICNKNVEMRVQVERFLVCSNIKTKDEALNYLSKFVHTTQNEHRLTILKKILKEKFLHNMNHDSKINFVAHMTSLLIKTMNGLRPEDDRDHYGKKRVETAGELMNSLFKSIWKNICKEVGKNMAKKRETDLSTGFYNKITKMFDTPFATGNWVAKKTNIKSNKVGVSQVLNTHNFISIISNIRRVITPSDKNNKITKPRDLHSSQWPFICPAETPEGQTCGFIKNLSMLTTISIETPDEPILDFIKMHKKKFLSSPDNIFSDTKIFVNGRWIGSTSKAVEFVEFFRKLRRQGKLNWQISISVNNDGINIHTDVGRLLHPFFIVKDGKISDLPTVFNWNQLLELGIVEYLDPTELETLKHATEPWNLTKTDTHSLIHPCFLLGISASTCPFPDHNQSPRVIYQSAMGKQALGVFRYNFLQRFDTSNHILCYPQRPLVDTATMRKVKSHDLPSGQNLMVAVMCGGDNQEDSVIISKKSIDNGLLRSINYYNTTVSNSRKSGFVDEIQKPDVSIVKETKLKGYSHLNDDGICSEGVPLSKNDVIIGKVKTSGVQKDTSVVIKSNGLNDDSVVKNNGTFFVNKGSSTVDRVIVTTNEESFNTVKTRVRQMRIPQVGDKVASRSAQKGIIGMIRQTQDLPFSEKTGIRPDLLMNPNAFPSRMTISHALEAILGKACALSGNHGDATPFSKDFVVEAIGEELSKHGFEAYGDEVMINGMTGERMECKIFFNPTYYQRLKHMVDDKIHARNQYGPRELLTRQPTEGRKKAGGFRFGEMETWCGVSHGASKFLSDRLLMNSDKYDMYVCNSCGNASIAMVKNHTFYCKSCDQYKNISKVRIPYAFKLLMQELQACGIGVWITVDTTKKLIE